MKLDRPMVLDQPQLWDNPAPRGKAWGRGSRYEATHDRSPRSSPEAVDPARLCAPPKLTRHFFFFLHLCSFNDSGIFATALSYMVEIQPDLWILSFICIHGLELRSVPFKGKGQISASRLSESDMSLQKLLGWSNLPFGVTGYSLHSFCKDNYCMWKQAPNLKLTDGIISKVIWIWAFLCLCLHSHL